MATQMDINGMRQTVIHMFCSRLDSLEGHATNLLRLHGASLESLREVHARLTQGPAQAITENEQKIMDFHKGLKKE